MAAWLEEELDAFDPVETHWSTGTIMAIFFAASLISAVFVGLGYSFGLGGTAMSTSSVAFSKTVHAAEQLSHSVRKAAWLQDYRSAKETKRSVVDSEGGVVLQPALAASRWSGAVAGHARAVPGRAAQPAVAVNASRYMVQVGAIGNRKDARKLVYQLRRKGFHAGIYPGKHDRYLHVQIGPFASTEQARAARRHVLASGFHAVLKRAS